MSKLDSGKSKCDIAGTVASMTDVDRRRNRIERNSHVLPRGEPGQRHEEGWPFGCSVRVGVLSFFVNRFVTEKLSHAPMQISWPNPGAWVWPAKFT